HGLGLLELLERVDGRPHDVDRVGRAERLREDVVDARALEDGADRTTGDHTGTGGRRAQQDDARCILALDRVHDGALDAGDAEEVLLRLLDTLGDRRRHLLGLAIADTDGAVAVTHHHEGGEGEATAALDDLGDTVDAHDTLEERRLLGGLTATATTLTTAAVAALAAAALVAVAGVGIPPAGGRGTVATLLCSHIQILFSSCVRAAVTAPGRPRGRRQRRRPHGRGTCCHRGRRRPRRCRRPWRARRPGSRRSGPCQSSTPRCRGGPPPWWRPTRWSCPGRRRRPARRRDGPNG